MNSVKIAYDRAQKAGKHEIKHNWIKNHGHELIALPLPVGDYIAVTPEVQDTIRRRGDRLKKMDLLAVTHTTIDTKQNLLEVCNNLVGPSHRRFRDEAILAQQNGIRFIVLVEDGAKIKCLDDVKNWVNPRRWQYCKKHGISTSGDVEGEIAEFVQHGGDKPPTPGPQLAKMMRTMSDRYGIIWEFCDKKHTGRRIVEILGDCSHERETEEMSLS